MPVAVPTHDMEVVHHKGAHLVTLDFGQEQVSALIREVQFDTLGKHMLHVDFDRIRAGEKVEVEVELTFFGHPTGEGAVFQVLFDQLRVRCLPGAIPDRIEADVRNLKKGEEIRVKDLSLPEGVEFVGIKSDEIVAIFAEVREQVEVPVEVTEVEPEVLTAREKKEEGETEEEKA